MNAIAGHALRATIALVLAVLLGLATAGCGDGAQPPPGEHGHAHDGGHAEPEAGVIAIPEPVRRNLGISFVEVQPRHVRQTLRVPGRFEYRPHARREYRMPVAGRVELLVEQFEHVEAGEPLYRIDSLEWRELQRTLADSRSAIERLELRISNYPPLLGAHEAHESKLLSSISVLEERVARLEQVRDAGGGRIGEYSQARSALAMAESELASLEEKHVELRAEREQASIDLRAAQERHRFLLGSAGAITGMTRAEMAEPIERDGREAPRWSAIDMIEVSAGRSGVVETLDVTDGAWTDQQSRVLRIVRPEMLRFRASGLQSDLGMLRPGLHARVVPPTPDAGTDAQAMNGILRLGLGGDPNDRTLELFVVPESLAPWARHGITAQLEIVTAESQGPVAAIPLSAVQRDGLTPVVFMLDPFDPGQVRRVEVELGSDDGRWVEVLDGVRIGNQIVLKGAFQLLLASSDSVQEGGHFHPDGTFHKGED